MFYKKHTPKSMLATKKLQLIDENPDEFKNWCCDFNCVKQPCKRDNEDPVSRHLCYKL